MPIPQGEVDDSSNRFAFGENWSRFLKTVDEDRIEQARKSLLVLLNRADLRGLSFLDAGCGSGLFSLAAARSGAAVTSFDADPKSVSCAVELERRFHSEGDWTIIQGSLTDADFMRRLDTFDVVYCWGVAHHTGQMWKALNGLLPHVRVGGMLVLAIYNDQQYISRGWRAIKRLYQRLPTWLRPCLVAAIGSTFLMKRALTTLLACTLRLLTLRNPVTPIANWIRESQSRGMHVWYDLVDWVGGWPFEVAKPEEVFRYVRDRGFDLVDLRTSQGHGCNEFVFNRGER